MDPAPQSGVGERRTKKERARRGERMDAGNEKNEKETGYGR